MNTSFESFHLLVAGKGERFGDFEKKKKEKAEKPRAVFFGFFLDAKSKRKQKKYREASPLFYFLQIFGYD